MTNLYWLIGSVGGAAVVSGIMARRTFEKIRRSEESRIKKSIRQQEKLIQDKWRAEEREAKHISLREEFLLDIEWNR